jgi:hypothetical protein
MLLDSDKNTTITTTTTSSSMHAASARQVFDPATAR